jgi:hypothetical protein
MKTKVEIEGYEIEISFEEGMISVTAQKDDEVVEEFSINIEEGQGDGQEESDIKGFGDYDEEEDFSDEDLEDDLESDDDDDDDEEGAQEEREGAALESFQSFISKK